MEAAEIIEIIKKGEDSYHQFKKNVTNADSLAADMVAFSNCSGGKMLIGVNDDGTIAGLSREEIQRIFQKANLIHADEMPVSGMTIEDTGVCFSRSCRNYQPRSFAE